MDALNQSSIKSNPCLHEKRNVILILAIFNIFSRLPFWRSLKNSKINASFSKSNLLFSRSKKGILLLILTMEEKTEWSLDMMTSLETCKIYHGQVRILCISIF